MKTVLTYCLLFITLAVSAQQFTASVDRKKLSTDQTLQITYALSNADGQNFSPPSFENFSVLSGPSQSTSMQIINGSVSRSVSFSYRLRPEKEGTFTIKPATIKVGNDVISSNSVTIEVVKGSVQNGGTTQNNQNKDIYAQIADDVFVRLIVDKTEVYKGEQLTATYKLYFKRNISNPQIEQPPKYTGFWAQNIDVGDVQFRPEVYKGVQYNAGVIKKDALFPQRTGTLTIEPMELKTNVRVAVKQKRRSPFDSFFDDFFTSYQNYPFQFKSNAVNITVKPLPQANKPPGFSGAVGEYTMDVSVDNMETQTDEPISLKIKISGKGNLKMLDMPTIDLPQDFDVFDPKQSENISKKSNTVNGSRSSEYLIIPRRPGEFKIPPVKFSYFDLKKKDYVTQTSPEYKIKVEGEASSTGPSITGINKEEVELLGEDIRYIKTGDADLHKEGDVLILSWAFAGFYASPMLLFLLLLTYKKRKEKIAGDTALVKRKRAAKEASKRLKRAKKLMKDQDRKAFFDETTRAIWGYLGDKLNIDQSQLNRDYVEKALQEKSVSEDTIQKTFKTLDHAEMALFAPSTDGEMERTYKEANELIAQLGSELK